MSSILDVTSLYNTYSQSAQTATASSLQASLGTIGESSSDEELLSVCKSFESYFVQKMIETAKTSIADEEEEGEYMQYFGDILNEQYANAVVEGGGIGLAQQLYEAMKTTYQL